MVADKPTSKAGDPEKFAGLKAAVRTFIPGRSGGSDTVPAGALEFHFVFHYDLRVRILPFEDDSPGSDSMLTGEPSGGGRSGTPSATTEGGLPRSALLDTSGPF